MYKKSGVFNDNSLIQNLHMQLQMNHILHKSGYSLRLFFCNCMYGVDILMIYSKPKRTK